MIKKIFIAVFFLVVTIFAGMEIDKKISAQNIEEVANGPKILVLNYHQVNNSFTPLAVPVNAFADQMNYLVDSGYIAITPDELASGLAGEITLPEKPVMITFDDGYIDNYTNAFPILKALGLRATVFMVPGFVGKPQYMSWENLKEMEKNGIKPRET